jgi:hypothetical protein
MSRVSRTLSFGPAALLCAGVLLTATEVRAEPSNDVFLLNTACIGLKDAFKASYAPSRCTGPGAFDAVTARIAMADGVQRFFVAYDDTGQWRKNSGMVAKYAIVDMSSAGLKIVKQDVWMGSAAFDKDRLFMRPAITVLKGDAQSPEGYFLLTGASEDNGTSGNPRTTVLIYNAKGEPILNVVGTSPGGKTYGPRGERGIDMGAIAGRDNNQQQGASSVHYIGMAGDAHVIAMAFQENNRAAYVATYKVRIQGTGADPKSPGATITAVSDAVLLQGEARHCRPTCALAEGTNPATFACATVHANEQPAEKGITVGRFDAQTGALLAATDVATPRPGNDPAPAAITGSVLTVPSGNRFSQSLLSCTDAACSSYVLETSHVQKSPRPNGNNGHTPGTHATDVILLDKETLAAKSFRSVGNFAHTHMLPLNYGPGAGEAAIGVLSAPLSGMKPAALQVLPLGGEGDIAAPSDSHRYKVSFFSNTGDMAARGLRNPNNQGRGFVSALANVPNPGKDGGWMSGIASFTAVPIPTFGTDGDATFMGLDLCFVPATYLPQYTKVAPGKVIRWNEAPVGPPPDPSNPNAAPGSEGSGAGATAAGSRASSDDGGGCGIAAHPGGRAFGAALLGLGLAVLGLRRSRREA